MAPSDLIKRYSLQPHPEGGYYTSTYQASMLLSQQDLPSVFKGDRPVSSAIYYLLEKGDFSSFHRIASDECWHFIQAIHYGSMYWHQTVPIPGPPWDLKRT